MKDNIGKKAKGVLFYDAEYPAIGWNESMNMYIGREGTIVGYHPADGPGDQSSYTLEFGRYQQWQYPAKLIEEQL